MASTSDTYQSKLRRPVNVGTRFSKEEFASIEDAADRDNVSISDWFRRTVLDSLAKKVAEDEPPLTVLLEEIQAVKLTLASTVYPLLSAKRMPEEQSAALLRDCDAAKTDAAKKVLKTFRDRKDRP